MTTMVNNNIAVVNKPNSNTVFYNKSNIYKFYSNRNLLQWPKSNETLNSDLKAELSINYEDAIKTFIKMKKQESIINKIIEKNSNNTFIEYMKQVLTNKGNEYNSLSKVEYCAKKYLYRLSIPNFIFSFAIDHKSILPNNISNQVLPLIENTTYNKQNDKLNTYIKKSLLLDIFMNTSDMFLDYYDYCRFLYMYNRLVYYKFTPLIYNTYTGSLYFTISYNLNDQKEQIFEELHKPNNNNVNIDIDEIKLYVNSELGEITKYRKLCDKRYKKFHTEISDNMSYKIPNIIRKLIHSLIDKYSHKAYKYSYNEILSYILKNNIIPEDFCEKINLNGDSFIVPINGKWVDIDSKSVRLLTKNNIDINLLLDKYKDSINALLLILSDM